MEAGKTKAFVEEVLGNLPISVEALRKALAGKSLKEAHAIMEGIKAEPVSSLEEFRDNRHLRGLLGTVRVLLNRLKERCEAEQEGTAAETEALLSMLAVLSPAGVPMSFFTAFTEDHEAIRDGFSVGAAAFCDPDRFVDMACRLEEVGLIIRDGIDGTLRCTSSARGAWCTA